jgi:hypothetical protein
MKKYIVVFELDEGSSDRKVASAPVMADIDNEQDFSEELDNCDEVLRGPAESLKFPFQEQQEVGKSRCSTEDSSSLTIDIATTKKASMHLEQIINDSSRSSASESRRTRLPYHTPSQA